MQGASPAIALTVCGGWQGEPARYAYEDRASTPHIRAVHERLNSWRLLELDMTFRPRGDAAIPRPANLERMLEVAARLSDGHDFVRVDLYHVQGRVYFGEMTFTPTRGVLKFKPDAWDRVLGELWLGAPASPRPSASPRGLAPAGAST